MNETLIFQQMYLDISTNELTAHGAMLFAVLSSTFVFLRIINDNYYTRKNKCTNDDKKIPTFHIIIMWIVLTVFIGSLFVRIW